MQNYYLIYMLTKLRLYSSCKREGIDNITFPLNK
jgi:hypothetical protein